MIRNLSKVLVILGMVLLPVLTEAAGLYVPGGYATIQSAVNAASAGDTIYVSAGTYNEAVYINKGIALVGVGTPTITASGLGETNAVTFEDIDTDSALISGFKITGATGNYPNGSGIYCNNGSPTISSNTISGNSSGIACDSSSPFITNNTISGNSKVGIACDSSSPSITNNILTGNSCGILCNHSSPSITNNTISGNSNFGIFCDSSSPAITNNTISGNSYGILCNSSSSPSITNNTISGNSTHGISCAHSSSPAITNNIISGNIQYGIYCAYSSPSITNNTISGNTSNGINCYYSSPTITNNTISGNSYGILCYSSSPIIIKNIITENGTTNTDYYGIYNAEGNPTIDYNCVWGNGSPITNNYYGCSAGPNDISLDPQFIEGDYNLGTNPPCIDVGSNTAPKIPSTALPKQREEQKLNEFISKNYDEFQKITWYETKRNTDYEDDSYHTFKVELYFGYSPNNKFFRLRTRYTDRCSDYHDTRWIFYERIHLLADNGSEILVKTDYPAKQSDNDTYGLTEWSDNLLSESEVLAFAQASKIKVRFYGKYTHEFSMTPNQLKAFKEIIEKFKSMAKKRITGRYNKRHK